MSALGRWNDDRLDDLARQVKANSERIEAVATVREELAAMRERLGAVGGDTHDCILELRELKVALEKRAEVQREERKADRRWLIGTMFAAASLVIAAVAVFIG